VFIARPVTAGAEGGACAVLGDCATSACCWRPCSAAVVCDGLCIPVRVKKRSGCPSCFGSEAGFTGRSTGRKLSFVGVGKVPVPLPPWRNAATVIGVVLCGTAARPNLSAGIAVIPSRNRGLSSTFLTLEITGRVPEARGANGRMPP
jgi:hypothetical protein